MAVIFDTSILPQVFCVKNIVQLLSLRLSEPSRGELGGVYDGLRPRGTHAVPRWDTPNEVPAPRPRCARTEPAGRIRTRPTERAVGTRLPAGSLASPLVNLRPFEPPIIYPRINLPHCIRKVASTGFSLGRQL